MARYRQFMIKGMSLTCVFSLWSLCARDHFSQTFFFLMIRRPPRSTLFPYTTPSDLRIRVGQVLRSWAVPRGPSLDPRSEEHTSELQSHSDLVCRLLLEKKQSIAHQGDATLPCDIAAWSEGHATQHPPGPRSTHLQLP